MSTTPFMTPGAGPVRARIEKRCAVAVVWLGTLPRAVPFVVVVVLFFAGVFLAGVVGCVLLLLVVALMALLTYLAWPSVTPGLRAARVLILVALTVFAVHKLF